MARSSSASSAEWALDHGFDAVATGHYARRATLERPLRSLLEGADPNKDQSYFLAMLSQEQLRDRAFPHRTTCSSPSCASSPAAPASPPPRRKTARASASSAR
ncbi:MAG: hypothetical protein QM760_16290 [Nibricoccus sp.]